MIACPSLLSWAGLGALAQHGHMVAWCQVHAHCDVYNGKTSKQVECFHVQAFIEENSFHFSFVQERTYEGSCAQGHAMICPHFPAFSLLRCRQRRCDPIVLCTVTCALTATVSVFLSCLTCTCMQTYGLLHTWRYVAKPEGQLHEPTSYTVPS